MANKEPDLVMGLQPIVLRLMERAPAQVKDWKLYGEVDHRMGERFIYLTVQHVVRKVEWDKPWHPVEFPDMEKRIRAALLIKEPSAKSMRVERRLMLARGEQARKSKTRRVR